MSDQSQTERVRSVFDDWAKRGRDEGMEKGHGPSARVAFESLELGPDSHYLDVGCGNGYTVRWAAERCPRGRVWGVDLAPEMIERARALSQGLINAEFRVGAFPDIELPSGAYTGIFSMEAYYYIPDLDAALARTCELLQPGGRFACVVDFYAENTASHGWPGEVGVAMTLLSESEWRDAFARAGLEVVRQERIRGEPGFEQDEWRLTEGSLFTLGRRP